MSGGGGGAGRRDVRRDRGKRTSRGRAGLTCRSRLVRRAGEPLRREWGENRPRGPGAGSIGCYYLFGVSASLTWSETVLTVTLPSWLSSCAVFIEWLILTVTASWTGLTSTELH